ncbi:SDR family oxidoreductase [Alkalicoccus chagannorensis]|uniref:SDR family oxidoreductase n=1 Tax=Alkalicoccus chagannorensis TaxID=427072 RepID=UPI0004142997|nr:SDR family oxidoreductase [Alkalicoccus chagannorensis]
MRHALVTAGTKGLGKQVASSLIEKGYSVTATYRSDHEAAESCRREWEAQGADVQLIQADVQKKEELESMMDQVLDTYRRLDVLVLNAGPYIFERKALADYNDEEWLSMMHGNLHSAFYLLRRAVPVMREQRFGRIVTYGFQEAGHAPGWLYRAAFASAKSGLVSLTRSVALEEAAYGITANMVCPGEILGEWKEAPISAAIGEKDENTPIGRPGTGGDIARAVTFFADDQADMVTGSVLEVTGAVDVIHKNL